MQRNKEISLVLTGIILSVLIIYGIWNLEPQAAYEFERILQKGVIKEAGKFIFPG